MNYNVVGLDKRLVYLTTVKVNWLFLAVMIVIVYEFPATNWLNAPVPPE